MTEQTQTERQSDDPAEDLSLAGNGAAGEIGPEPAAEGTVPAGNHAGTADGPAVNLDDAEQQIAEWRRDDAALLGEPPELAPAPQEGREALPASTDEAEISALREEAEALLGEGLEAKSVPTAEEARLS